MLCLLVTSVFALAQGGGTLSSISGLVVDTSGAVIPGADVVIKNTDTGGVFKTVTAGNGTFGVPALGAGTYSATVTMSSFKQAVHTNIRLEAAVPAYIRVVLQVGGTNEKVVVEAGAEMVQSQTASITSTLNVTQIADLPSGSRSVLNAVLLSTAGISISGVDTLHATAMGLPANMINLTIDGVSVQDEYNKTSQGFTSRERAGVDAMEAVTASTGALDAESSGAGAVQVRFITRSGTNEYHGGAYDYIQNDAFNANTWFNNRNITAPAGQDWSTWKSPPPKVRLNQTGGRFGGPISLPKKLFGPLGFDGRDRAYLFLDFEELVQPGSVTTQNTMFTPQAQQGNYLWTSGGVTRSVNLLQLAAGKGFTSIWDPTVQQMLADMQASTPMGSLMAGNDPRLQTLTFTLPSPTRMRYITSRLDFNLTSRHHLEITWNHNVLFCTAYDTTNNYQPTFPNSINYGEQCSQRYNGSAALRSTLTPRMVNEFRSGLSGGPSLFNSNMNPAMFSGSVYNMQGYTVSVSAAGITNPWVSSSGERRNATAKMFEDSLKWSKGEHSISFGGSFAQYGVRDQIPRFLQTPSVTLGLDTTYDPAQSMFDSVNGPKNFPGASSSQLSAAGAMYGVLIGSVTQLGGTAYLDGQTNKYVFNGNTDNLGHYREYGLFGQDSWRIRPNLTLTYGLRWELQRPYVPGNDVYSTATIADVWGVSGIGNLMKPGTLTGTLPQFIDYTAGTKAYNQQWKNFAPSFGFAWQPKSENKWLKRVLGEAGQSVIRGGYSIAYGRMGLSNYANAFSSNPGGSLTANRNDANSNLVSGVGTDTWPLLFSQKSRLGPPSFLAAPTYPITSSTYSATSSMTVFDPNIKTPYAQSWTFGFQRELTKSMALEIRYAGTKGLQPWYTYNLNSDDSNMLENGVYNEFNLAVANLQANVAAGKASSGFKYMGPGTGTNPLPITLGWFNGLPASSASDPSKYTGSNWTNSTYEGYLNKVNLGPGQYGSALYSTATNRANGAAAGYPANFFVTNPNLLGGANILGNGGWTQYDSMVIEFRRRMAKGLLVQANYTFSRAFASTWASFRRPWYNDPSTYDVPHVVKLNWVWELPVGKGRRFGGSTWKRLDTLIGGWDLHGIFRIQSGNLMDFGNVTLVGMTAADLQSAYQLRFDNANRIIYNLPADIIQNTINAYSFSPTSANGYSGAVPTGRFFAPARWAGCDSILSLDCAPRHQYVRAAPWDELEASLVKIFRFTEQKNLEFRAELLNAFNETNFSYTTSCTGTNVNMCQVTGTLGNPRVIQVVLRLNF
jgi:hypothetical protein